MKNKTIHIISQAHLDLAWLWSWQESYSEAINNIRTIVRLMRKYPELKFSYSNAVIYKWILDSNPELFAKIQKLVEAKRWEIIGGWWVESDCNLPSGESLIRQAAHGKEFFSRHFKQNINVGYCPDAFGHCGGLPQILKTTGFEYYVFSKPRLGKYFPHLFLWESPDGSRIPTWRIYGGYATGPESTPETLEKEIYYAANNNFPPNCNNTAIMLGLGDHGGGPSETQIKAILDLAKREDLPNIKFSTFNELFANLQKDICFDELPVIKGEIQPHNIGCYSANGKIKSLNRKTENELFVAESVEVLAQMSTNQKSQIGKLDKAWKGLLFNQFHDIIAGTCIERCYEDAYASIGNASQTAKRVTTTLMHRISGSVDTSNFKNNGIFVFNPLPWKRKECISLDMFTAIDGCEGPVIKSVIDPQTKELLPVQWTAAASPYGPWLKEWEKLLVQVELPPCGYSVFELSSEESSIEPKSLISWKPSQINMGIENLHDISGNVFFKDAIKLIVCDDDSDTFGHNRTSFLSKKGYVKFKEIFSLETGPYRHCKRLTGKYNDSDIELKVFTYPETNYFDIEISGNWQEKNKVLKLEIPNQLEDSRTFYEMPFECIERAADGREVPGHSWSAISGKLDEKMFNIGIINNGVYSFDSTNEAFHLTIRRSVQAVHYNDLQYSKEQGKKYLDQGSFSESLRIVMWEGKWDSAHISKKAKEYQISSYSLMDTNHEGANALSESYLQLNSKTTIISALKIAADGNSIVVRLAETGGNHDTANIISNFLGINSKFDLKPYQVITIRFSLDGTHYEGNSVNALEL